MKFFGSSKNQDISDKIVNKFKDIAKKSGKKVKTSVNKEGKSTMLSIFVEPGFKAATVDKVLTKMGFTKTQDVSFGDGSTASVYFMSAGKRAAKAIIWLNGDSAKYICLNVSRSASSGNQEKKAEQK